MTRVTALTIGKKFMKRNILLKLIFIKFVQCQKTKFITAVFHCKLMLLLYRGNIQTKFVSDFVPISVCKKNLPLTFFGYAMIYFYDFSY